MLASSNLTAANSQEYTPSPLSVGGGDPIPMPFSHPLTKTMCSNHVASAVRPYAIAIVSTGAATWLRTLLDPFLGTECPFSIFYLSVLLTAWLAGTFPAILSLILGTIAAAQFFIPPTASILITDPSDVLNAAIYVFVNCVAISLFASLDRERQNIQNRLEENEQLGASLKLADERKDEFLALLAHELRNPLAPIRSSLMLLERKQSCPQTIERVRIVCQRQIHQLVRLVDDLMDISRFLRGSLKLQVEKMDLRDAIHIAIEMSDEAIQQKSHRFDALLPDTAVWINGDPVRIAQLVENLLGNAAKYTPKSGRILLQLEQRDGQAVLSISDNGIGFPPSESARILEPFTQMDTSRTREYGGLGIGLSIVRQIVELHKGTLTPESRGPGTGSRFTVHIPLATAEIDLGLPVRDETDCTMKVEAVSDVRSNQISASILIVEDNVDAGEALRELLEMEDFSVEVAHDAVAALKALENSIPEIILLDIGLPGMDGYQLARRIRQRWASEEIFLVACTGWGGEADRQAAKDAGFDHHLVKPVNFTDLVSVLNQRLEGNQQLSLPCKPEAALL